MVMFNGNCPLCRSVRPRRRIYGGFTLVEILIATSLMVMVVSGVYQLYHSVSVTHSKGAWASRMTIRLRNMLRLLKDEISSVTPPEKVTATGTVQVGTPAERLFYCPSTLPFVTQSFSGNSTLLQFFMTQPGRDGIPGFPDKGTEIMRGTLRIEGGKILYYREIQSQPSTVASKTGTLNGMIVTENPDKVEISTREETTASLSVKLRNFVTVKITARHPRYPGTTVTESIEAPFEVPVQMGGFP